MESMTNQSAKVDAALEEFNKDRSATHIISNLCSDLSEPDAAQKLFAELQPFPDELYIYVSVVFDVLRKAVETGADVSSEDFDTVESWFEAGLNKVPYGKSYACLEMASMFSPNANAFSDDPVENARFSNMDKVRKWVGLAVDTADGIDDYLVVIGEVAGRYSGLHIGDKEWAENLITLISERLDPKDAKTFKTKSKKVLLES